MHRTKTTARRSHRVATSSSSTEDDMYLDANQEEAPAPSSNAASFSAVSQRRGGVLSQGNHSTSKYETQWKDDLSMFTNIEVARVISSAFKSSMEIPLFQWSRVSRHPEWIPNIDAWFDKFENRQIHGSLTTHTGGSVPYATCAKQMICLLDVSRA